MAAASSRLSLEALGLPFAGTVSSRDTVWYNWMKIHKTLRATPAMEAGLTDRVFDMTDLVELIEQAEMTAMLAPEAQAK